MRFALHGTDEDLPMSGTVVLRVDDLESTRWTLEQRGVVFDAYVGEVEGFARFATFRDPDGNPVQIIEYAGGRLSPARGAAGRCHSRANFCPNCGAPVAVPQASERRLVTVVFVDLTGSTELATQLDAERFRDILAAFHGMVTEEIAWLGGVAETFIGDAVLVVFGVPSARDDDAVRAIRAALDIRERARDLCEDLGLSMPMEVRIGVRTGQVAVGTAFDRNIVIGAEVNIGARLQQAATPGEILAGSSTMHLARDAVEFGESRTIEAKGFERAITAWPVAGLRQRIVDRRRISFVDRRRELSLLNDMFDRAAARERAHLVTLLGEPGIGKSRVVTEFLAGLPEGTKVLTGRSSPFEEDVAFWPLAQMLHRQLGEDTAAPSADLEDRLRAAVAEWVDPDEVEPAARRLGLALGLHDDGGDDNRYQPPRCASGVLAMLAGLARSGPVVLVFEDLHQADPLLLDLIEQLVKEARKRPAARGVRRAVGVPRGPAELGGRARRRRDALGGAARARPRDPAGDGRRRARPR